jgi:vancomycin resistance protein YoaR
MALGGRCRTQEVVEAIWQLGRGESGVERVRERVGLLVQSSEVDLPVAFEPDAMKQKLRAALASIGKRPRNARIRRTGDGFTITEGRPGRVVDLVQLARSVERLYAETDLNPRVAPGVEAGEPLADWLAAASPLTVDAAMTETPPRVTAELLKSIDGLLSSFTTSLGGSSRNRVHNIGLACKEIDGTVLLPGEVFSYNETVGPRSSAAGYREAPIIVKGKLVPGLAGGICQVSTTVFNAALLSGLEIESRRNHALPVHYVPAGRDATVSYGSIDLRFKNDLGHPIYLEVDSAGRRVTVKIWGHTGDKREVRILTSRVTTIGAGVSRRRDPRLPSGRVVVDEPARSGKRVSITVVVQTPSGERRQRFASFYRPQDAIIRVGTRPVPPPTRPETALSTPREGVRTEPEPSDEDQPSTR